MTYLYIVNLQVDFQEYTAWLADWLSLKPGHKASIRSQTLSETHKNGKKGIFSHRRNFIHVARQVLAVELENNISIDINLASDMCHIYRIYL